MIFCILSGISVSRMWPQRKKEYTVDDKILEIEERIASDDFVRCHTSFLVNFFLCEGMYEEENAAGERENCGYQQELLEKDGRGVCGMGEEVGEVETE